VSFLIKDNRLDEWAIRKKSVEVGQHINFDSTGRIKFRIRPWSIVKIGVIRTANRNMSGHCNGTNPDSISVDIRTLESADRYVRTA
jgi:hypothetical protein